MHIAVSIDRPPEPELHPVDRYDDLVDVPLVAGCRSVTLSAAGEMAPEAVDPLPHSLPADNHTALSQEVLDITGAEREPILGPDHVSHDLARKR